MRIACRLITLLLGGLLASCATTRIQLFTEGLEATELQLLQQTLREEGYRTVLNARPVPEQIRAPTVVYSPYHKDHAQLTRLSGLLSELGYGAQLVPVSIGNNFYTGNNVGLYLKARAEIVRPEAVGAVAPGLEQKLAGKEFSGLCPEVDAYLALHADHRFVLDILGWDEVSAAEQTTKIIGNWRLAGAALRLDTGAENFAFRVEHTTDWLQVAGNPAAPRASVVVEGIRLVADGASPENCSFVFRFLVQL